MKIYVSNIKFSSTEEELKSVFATFGEVHSVKIIIDRRTRRSKGFGFVEMDDEAAMRAIEELDGQEIGGRPLKVNKAHDREEGSETIADSLENL
jgi:RNA recognition motif-containing protein